MAHGLEFKGHESSYAVTSSEESAVFAAVNNKHAGQIVAKLRESAQIPIENVRVVVCKASTPWMTSQANSSHSPFMHGGGAKERQI